VIIRQNVPKKVLFTFLKMIKAKGCRISYSQITAKKVYYSTKLGKKKKPSSSQNQRMRVISVVNFFAQG
jgi:hypothetical protein